MPDTAIGEVVNRALKHKGTSVRKLNSSLSRPVRLGIKATVSIEVVTPKMRNATPRNVKCWINCEKPRGEGYIARNRIEVSLPNSLSV